MAQRFIIFGSLFLCDRVICTTECEFPSMDVLLDEFWRCVGSRSPILPGFSCQSEFESKFSTRNASATYTSIRTLVLRKSCGFCSGKNKFPSFVFYRLPPCQCSSIKWVIQKIAVEWGPRRASSVLPRVRRFESCTSAIFPKSPEFKIQVYVFQILGNLTLNSSNCERSRFWSSENRTGVLNLRTWSQNRT